MKRIKRRGKMEAVISLINIVFLILIFFMVTGTLSQKQKKEVQFIQTSGLDCCVEPDALVISRKGELSYKGAPLSSPEEYLEQLDNKGMVVSLLPEQDLPAHQLLAIVKRFQSSGAEQVIVLTENIIK